MIAAVGSVNTNRAYLGSGARINFCLVPRKENMRPLLTFLRVTTVRTAVVLADKLLEVLINDPIIYCPESVCLGDCCGTNS